MEAKQNKALHQQADVQQLLGKQGSPYVASS